MQQNFIKIEVNPIGDLFVPGAEYVVKTVLQPTKRFGPYLEDSQKQRDKIVRREVMETIYHMLNTRTNDHVMGYLSGEQVKYVRNLEQQVSNAGRMPDTDGLVSFFRYVNEIVMPRLWGARPGERSRYHKNYLERWNALSEFLNITLKVYQTR